MAEHTFHLTTKWSGGRLGHGAISSNNLSSAISIPSEMGGPGIGTNPEEMLMGAAATCYIITLAAIMENRRLPVTSLTMRTEAVVTDNGNLQFHKIIHRPRIVLAEAATEQQMDTVRMATERADHACMISKALRGNVEIVIEPEIIF